MGTRGRGKVCVATFLGNGTCNYCVKENRIAKSLGVLLGQAQDGTTDPSVRNWV